MKTNNLTIRKFYNKKRPNTLRKVLKRMSAARELDLANQPDRRYKTLKALEAAWQTVPKSTLSNLLCMINFQESNEEIWQLSDSALRNKINNWTSRRISSQKKKTNKKLLY